MSCHYNNNNRPNILHHTLFKVFMNVSMNPKYTPYSLSISCGILLFHLVLDIDFTTFATSVIHYIIVRDGRSGYRDERLVVLSHVIYSYRQKTTLEQADVITIIEFSPRTRQCTTVSLSATALSSHARETTTNPLS